MTEIDHRRGFGPIDFFGHWHRELIFGRRRRFATQLGSLPIDKSFRRY